MAKLPPIFLGWCYAAVRGAGVGNRTRIDKTSKSQKLSKDEVQANVALGLRRWEAVENSFRTLVRGLVVVGAVYVGVYLPVSVSHGEVTTINFVLNWLTSLKLDVLVSWGAAAVATGVAVAEKKKRLKERKEKDERIRILEESIDPKRTSSNLLPDGSVVVRPALPHAASDASTASHRSSQR
jgi:hypothetical protein